MIASRPARLMAAAAREDAAPRSSPRSPARSRAARRPRHPGVTHPPPGPRGPGPSPRRPWEPAARLDADQGRARAADHGSRGPGRAGSVPRPGDPALRPEAARRAGAAAGGDVLAVGELEQAVSGGQLPAGTRPSSTTRRPGRSRRAPSSSTRPRGRPGRRARPRARPVAHRGPRTQPHDGPPRPGWRPALAAVPPTWAWPVRWPRCRTSSNCRRRAWSGAPAPTRRSCRGGGGRPGRPIRGWPSWPGCPPTRRVPRSPASSYRRDPGHPGVADGYWLNIPGRGPGCPTCNSPRPGGGPGGPAHRALRRMQLTGRDPVRRPAVSLPVPGVPGRPAGQPPAGHP